METAPADLEALIAAAVARALADRDAQAQIDAATAQAEADRRRAQQLADEEAMLVANAFAMLPLAIQIAAELERVAHDTRPLKVAFFDATGRYCGWQETRADLIELHASDEYRRIAWRPEWNGLREVALPMTGPWMLTALPIPNLANIPGGVEEAANSFVTAPRAAD